MPKLSEEELKKLQKLSNCYLTDEEKEIFLTQLDNIIGLLDQLSEVDLTGVEPLAHPIAGHTTVPQDMPTLDADTDGWMLKNVKHRMINNAVKMKSMLH